MLKFTGNKLSDDSAVLRVEHSNYKDVTSVRDYGLARYPWFQTNDSELRIFHPVNDVFKLMQDVETDFLFNLILDIEYQMAQHCSHNEFKDKLDEIGIRLCNEITKMKLVDYCGKIPFDSFPITLGRTNVSFVKLNAVIKILFPIIILALDKAYTYGTNNVVNKITINRLLKPTITNYFSKEKTVLSHWVKQETEHYYPGFQSILNEHRGLKTMSAFTEAFLCDLFGSVFVTCSFNNYTALKSIKDFLYIWINSLAKGYI